MTQRDTERGRDTGRGRSRLHAGSPMWDSTRSRVSRITPWAEGGAKPLSHPGCLQALFLYHAALHTRARTQTVGTGQIALNTFPIPRPEVHINRTKECPLVLFKNGFVSQVLEEFISEVIQVLNFLCGKLFGYVFYVCNIHSAIQILFFCP